MGSLVRKGSRGEAAGQATLIGTHVDRTEMNNNRTVMSHQQKRAAARRPEWRSDYSTRDTNGVAPWIFTYLSEPRKCRNIDKKTTRTRVHRHTHKIPYISEKCREESEVGVAMAIEAETERRVKCAEGNLLWDIAVKAL